jgi:hypothetical protein
MIAVAASALVVTPFAWTDPQFRWPLLVGVLTVASMLLIVASPFLLDWVGGHDRFGPRAGPRARRR